MRSEPSQFNKKQKLRADVANTHGKKGSSRREIVRKKRKFMLLLLSHLKGASRPQCCGQCLVTRGKASSCGWKTWTENVFRWVATCCSRKHRASGQTSARCPPKRVTPAVRCKSGMVTQAQEQVCTEKYKNYCRGCVCPWRSCGHIPSRGDEVGEGVI